MSTDGGIASGARAPFAGAVVGPTVRNCSSSVARPPVGAGISSALGGMPYGKLLAGIAYVLIIGFGVMGLFVGPVLLAASYTLTKSWIAEAPQPPASTTETA